MEKHTVSKLIGAPPGYVGYDEAGQLTERVRRKPYSVVLFDEVEKAHPDVFNVLLQVLEDGRLTDAQGRLVDFRNTVLIMTSNVGATTFRSEITGFSKGSQADSYKDMKATIMNELRRTFRPEFLNRVDETVVFHSLSMENIKSIVDLMIAELAERLKENDMMIEIAEEAKVALAEEGFSEEYGARPLRRAIQRFIEDEISEAMLEQKLDSGDTIYVYAEDGKVKIEKKETAKI